jgi:cytochrome o ubiquinol oxidase subunit IV
MSHEADVTDMSDVAPGVLDEGTGNVWRMVLLYLVGLILAASLTAGSFLVVGTNLIWGPGIPAALVVLAIGQIGVHLVFFLHLTTAPDNTNTALALAFGVLIVALVLGGSLWIMAHLDHRMMMPMPSAPFS